MIHSHHSRVLTLAAGAAFLALLDVTVVNLAIPALGRDYPTTSVTTLSWVITAYATLFAALLAPAGRLADVIGRRTLYRVGVGGFAALSLDLRRRAQRAGAARRSRRAGRVRGDDDPRLAGDPAGRHAGRAPGQLGGAVERHRRVRRRRGSERGRRSGSRLRLALAVRHQRPHRIGPGGGRRHPAAHRDGAHAPARCVRHRAAGARDRPGGTRPLPGLGVGLGRRADDREPGRRRRRNGGGDPAVLADAGPRDRDGPVEAPDVRAGQRSLAALRRQPLRVDAARRARAHPAVALLRAAGGPGDDPRARSPPASRPWWSGAGPPRGPRWPPERR